MIGFRNGNHTRFVTEHRLSCSDHRQLRIEHFCGFLQNLSVQTFIGFSDRFWCLKIGFPKTIPATTRCSFHRFSKPSETHREHLQNTVGLLKSFQRLIHKRLQRKSLRQRTANRSDDKKTIRKHFSNKSEI